MPDKLSEKKYKSSSTPVKLAKSVYEYYAKKCFEEPEFITFSKTAIDTFDLNNNNNHLKKIIDDGETGKDVRFRLAWEYLRRNHLYQYSCYKTKKSLTALKREIENNPEDYFKNENLKNLCRDHVKWLVYLNLFGLSNPLNAPCPTSNDVPKFLYSNFIGSEFVVEIQKEEGEDEDDNSSDTSSKKIKTPTLNQAVYKMGLIQKSQMSELRRYRRDYDYIIGFDISLAHDIDKQLKAIKDIVKNRKEEIALRRHISIKDHEKYLSLIDKMHNINTENWTCEIENVRNDTIGVEDSAFYERLGKTIKMVHRREFLDIIGLHHLRNLTNKKIIKILDIEEN